MEPTPDEKPAGTITLFNKGCNAPNITIAKIKTVANCCNISFIELFSYHGSISASSISTKGLLVTVTLSPLASSNPSAS